MTDPYLLTPAQRSPTVVVIEPPDPWVTVQDLKDYMLIEHTDWDATRIPLALNAAMAVIEGPRGLLGRCIGAQTLELRVYGGTRQRFDLPYPPIIEIVSAEYDDTDNNIVALDDSAYLLRRQSLQFVDTLSTYNELRVRYRAGHLPVGSDSPQAEAKEITTARMAVLLMAAGLLRPADREANEAAARRLLEPLRIFSIA